MASSKDTFEPRTFGARTFSPGILRGVLVVTSRYALGKLFVYPRAEGGLTLDPQRASGVLFVSSRTDGTLFSEPQRANGVLNVSPRAEGAIV